MEMRAFRHLISIEVARSRLLREARPIDRTERVLLDTAIGRVAARTVRAPRPIPAFPRATWDGYALRSADVARASRTKPVHLRIVGEVYAEGRFDRPVKAGECVAIATGARLPVGADTVEIFERVRRTGSNIVLGHPVAAAVRIAQRGEDFARGAKIVAGGEVLSPAAIGGIAAIGRERAEVYARPIVAILPNGNELLAPGRPWKAGGIYDSNNATLGAVIRATGGVPRSEPPIADDPRAIERAIRAALRRSDLVLVTGGSSVGEHDYLPQILPRMGRLLFRGIAVRPGKPTLAAVRGGRLIVAMPGHPTSCLSNAYWLLLPVLRRLARLVGPGWEEIRVRLAASPDRPSPDLTTVVPLRLERGLAYPTFHDSHAITSLSGVGAFSIVPPGGAPLRRGSIVGAYRLLPPLGPA
ncbi:MAG: molybdopterin molybdotransferase MoeA [Thermoplasmata archaeon]